MSRLAELVVADRVRVFARDRPVAVAGPLEVLSARRRPGAITRCTPGESRAAADRVLAGRRPSGLAGSVGGCRAAGCDRLNAVSASSVTSLWEDPWRHR
ncbi:hypothetical protein GCM10012275_37980 [Longimycelium tulufanense]|uniref:Uncharacterized protein n=1 Tax=Longimycelium tulufanense TaxID=907463 RepID=A0A8J3CGS3_9PSEU|nr:hypothetical protein GCM10012275_37980 [Longimycelium tulufanense]